MKGKTHIGIEVDAFFPWNDLPQDTTTHFSSKRTLAGWLARCQGRIYWNWAYSISICSDSRLNGSYGSFLLGYVVKYAPIYSLRIKLGSKRLFHANPWAWQKGVHSDTNQHKRHSAGLHLFYALWKFNILILFSFFKEWQMVDRTTRTNTHNDKWIGDALQPDSRYASNWL